LRKDAGRPATDREGRAFRRVLVANRGEIAVRIIRACHDLGMETVAVYSDADRHAVHVAAADIAKRIGPAPALESYLDAERILEVASELGVDAIHPGYGFLAERATFAAAVEAAGIAFVGPGSGAIARLGDKLAARRLATQVDVPVVPGTLEPAPVDRPDQLEAVLQAAHDVGFPLLVKAAAGGGGRGIRRVERPQDLPAALAAGSSEARSAFGDGSVYLEREIRPARHVEVQLLGDRHGTVLAIGERDCSTQRRHQKLVEEAPAPGIAPALRQDLHAAATRLGRAAGLENAATAEFLLDQDGNFWFLEVNTRLQVEHGVTELVAGIDLVVEQLRIAAGRPISADVVAAARQAADPRRHAIEARLSAEDPLGFAPAPGRVGTWQPPEVSGVRVDAGIRSGDQISPDYDPMFAKVMAVAGTRDEAIDRLATALATTVVTGVQSTLPFHRWLLRDGAFRSGQLSTELVGARWDPVAAGERQHALKRAAQLAADAVAASLASGAPVLDAGDGSGHLEGTDAGAAFASNWPVLGRGPTPGWQEAARHEAVDRWPRSRR
jgi:acetyl/propionyl-CoA carboxylase alpha subunit